MSYEIFKHIDKTVSIMTTQPTSNNRIYYINPSRDLNLQMLGNWMDELNAVEVKGSPEDEVEFDCAI
jgi:hypothetical protein